MGRKKKTYIEDNYTDEDNFFNDSELHETRKYPDEYWIIWKAQGTTWYLGRTKYVHFLGTPFKAFQVDEETYNIAINSSSMRKATDKEIKLAKGEN